MKGLPLLKSPGRTMAFFINCHSTDTFMNSINHVYIPAVIYMCLVQAHARLIKKKITINQEINLLNLILGYCVGCRWQVTWAVPCENVSSGICGQ